MTVAPTCTSCAGVLPEGARFCPSCGNPVAGDAGVEERRIVTVLFADLAGFTSLAEHRDPESVKELLDRCFEALVPIIESYGGHVDKIIGDELMALFGAPVAHDDDAERAVTAALALGPALQGVDAELRLRVGVNTGEVLAGAVGPSSDYTVTGDVVNTAHRLVSEAGSGEVVVGERTHQATTRAFVYEFLGNLDIKGKAERVPAWIARDRRDRTEPMRSLAGQTGFVGRDLQLDELTAQVDRALAGATPQVITVIGEPGVGKTRLALELIGRLTSVVDPPRVLWVTCPPYGPGGDLAPLAELVRLSLAIEPALDTVMQEDLLAVRVRDLADETGADAALLRDRLGMLLGLGVRPSRTVAPDTGPSRAGAVGQQLAAVRSVLAADAARRPLVVVVDDLHWAGDGVVRFLGQLPERLQDHPLAVVALARDDLLERRPTLVSGGAGCSTLTLEPLDAPATADLVMALLERHGAGPTVSRVGPASLDRLVAAGGGNPLLLEQLVGYLVDTAALTESDGRWQWNTVEAGVEPPLPDGIRSLIGARLDSLPADQRAVLATASVFGRRFWRAAVRDLHGGTEVDASLDRLLDRGLVHEVDDEGAGDLAFHHVLTRDVAYASVPIGDRATRHAQLARWLDDAGRSRDAGVAANASVVPLLAHHYERAVVLARSVDHTDPGLAGAAFSALARAARDEISRGGLHQADQWYRRARDLGTLDQAAWLDLLVEHGRVLLEMRRFDDAAEAFEAVERRAAGRRPELEATALAHLGAIARLTGDSDLARERFEAASARWRDLGDAQGQIDTLRLQGWSDITAGRFRAALPRLQRAAALEELHSAWSRRSETLRYLGWCEFLQGDVESARIHLWEAMSQGDGTDPGTLGWCFGLLAFTMLQGGQASRSLEVCQNLRGVAHRNGDSWGEWTSATLEAASLLALGRTDDAASLAAQAEWHLEEIDDAWGLALCRVVAAQAARVAGESGRARVILQRAISASRAVPHVGEDARLLAELARVELEAGDPAEAERQARSGLALVRAGVGDQESGTRCLVVLAEHARLTGRTADAELLLEEAAAPREPADRTDAWRQAALLLAAARLEAGDLDRATELLEATEDPPTEEIRLRAQTDALRRRIGT